MRHRNAVNPLAGVVFCVPHLAGLAIGCKQPKFMRHAGLAMCVQDPWLITAIIIM